MADKIFQLYTEDYDNCKTATQQVFINHEYMKDVLSWLDNIDYTQLKTTLDNNAQNINKNTTDITDLKTKVQANSDSIDTLNTQYNSINSGLKSLDTRVQPIETNLEVVETTVSSHTAQLTRLQGDLRQAQTDITNIEGDVANVEADIAELQKLPTPTEADNGKVLGVKDNAYAFVEQSGGATLGGYRFGYNGDIYSGSYPVTLIAYNDSGQLEEVQWDLNNIGSKEHVVYFIFKSSTSIGGSNEWTGKYMNMKTGIIYNTTGTLNSNVASGNVEKGTLYMLLGDLTYGN